MKLNECFELSIRTQNFLREAKIYTVEQLLSKSKAQLSLIRNCGIKSINEIEDAVKNKGFKLRKDHPKENQIYYVLHEIENLIRRNLI